MAGVSIKGKGKGKGDPSDSWRVWMQAVINESAVIGDVEVEISNGNTHVMMASRTGFEYDVTADLHDLYENLVVNVTEPAQTVEPEQAEQPDSPEHPEQPSSSPAN